MKDVIVTQIIPTVQGEGPSIGTPVLLIRLGNCNLSCDICDTKWSNFLTPKMVKAFSSRNKTFPFKINGDNYIKFIEYLDKEFLSYYNISTILLTGGEPFLHKDFIQSLVFSGDRLRNIMKIEIETNGVLLNDKDDYKMFNHWDKNIQINISPKLVNSSYKSEKINSIYDIVEIFQANTPSIDGILKESPTSINWKFIYAPELEERINIFIKNVLNINSIYIMPLTPDYNKYKKEMHFLEDFRNTSYKALNYCLKKGYIFTPRAHVWIFNNFKHKNELMDCMIKL